MSVYQELVNFDEVFNTLSTTPVIVNDMIDTSEEDKEKIRSQIYMKYNNDMLSSLPSCECGNITGAMNVGLFCNNCNSHVQTPLEQDIEPILWMRAPRGVAKLINPAVWLMLSDRFTQSGFDILQWLCDASYRPTVKMPEVASYIEQQGMRRGYNYFVENFFNTIDFLFNLKAFKRKNNALRDLLFANQDRIFSNYIPLPNKAILVIEENASKTYVDPIVIGAVDAIQTISSVDSAQSQLSVKVKENRTVKTIAKLAEFYDVFCRDSLAQKGGIFRKHIFGTRSHFSFRAVVSSITGVHDYEEIHISWSVAVSVFKIHLVNKLCKQGMNAHEATRYLTMHASVYTDRLNDMFKELINQAPNPKGIPVMVQRNPSLMRGSAQLCFITKVKTEVDDPTVGLSILIVKGMNCDRKLMSSSTVM